MNAGYNPTGAVTVTAPTPFRRSGIRRNERHHRHGRQELRGSKFTVTTSLRSAPITRPPRPPSRPATSLSTTRATPRSMSMGASTSTCSRPAVLFRSAPIPTPIKPPTPDALCDYVDRYASGSVYAPDGIGDHHRHGRPGVVKDERLRTGRRGDRRHERQRDDQHRRRLCRRRCDQRGGHALLAGENPSGNVTVVDTATNTKASSRSTAG